VLAFFAFRYSASVTQGGGWRLRCRRRTLSAPTLIEALGRHGLWLMEGPWARRSAPLLPLIGSFFLFILFATAVADPGILPPTASLKTNVALAMLVFVLTHVFGCANMVSSTSSTYGALVWRAR